MEELIVSEDSNKRTAEEAGISSEPPEAAAVPVVSAEKKPELKPEGLEPVASPPVVRQRLTYGGDKEKKDRSYNASKSGEARWRPHRQAEDYINLVGDIMYPSTTFSPFGDNSSKKEIPLARITTLGYLLSPLRRPTTIMERWSPYEVSVFEASIMLYGKKFDVIQKYVKSKTTKEVIEFYYCWKKTGHYKQWKTAFVPDAREQPVEGKPEPIDD